jgi:hypothetical protein
MSLNHITNADADQLNLYAKSYNSKEDVFYPTLQPLTFQGSSPAGFVSSIFNKEVTREIYYKWDRASLVGSYVKLQGKYITSGIEPLL